MSIIGTMSKKNGLVSRIQESYNQAHGLGDMVADAIKATTGIKSTEDCGCDRRRQKLNKWIPFHKRK
jgi:hypothetical protein